MTQQPFYPPQYPQAPAQPQQSYPQQQFPAYPQAPQQGYPQQPYAQPVPQQPYAQPVPQQPYAPPVPQQQAQPLVSGTLDDFYNQPSSGGGPSLKFEQVGTRYIGVVTRPLGPGDVQQQTDTQGRPLFFKDGRPKFVMKVPLQMQPSATYPDGIAQWYVKGGTRDELARAMAEANAPTRDPEAGAVIDITFTGTRASGAGMNPAKVFKVVYTPAGGQGQPSTGAASPAPEQAPQPVQQPVDQGQQYGNVGQILQQQQIPQPVQQGYAQPGQQPAQPQIQQQAPVQQVPQTPAPQPPSDLTPEQQQLLAKLTGGQG